MQPQKPAAPRRKAKPSANEAAPTPTRKETPRLASSNIASQSTAVANTSQHTENNQKPPSSQERELKLSGSESEDYDLGSAPPNPKSNSISVEELFGLLYSEGYLDTLTNDPRLLANFTSFLAKYKPSVAPLVLRYLETQKVIKVINYANAVASSFSSENFSPAAEVSTSFKSSSDFIFQTFLNDALPAWITYSLTRTASLCLTAEITNTSTSLTQDLVKGLSEIFCLTDPTKPDNPIIYASSEFYSLTGYPKDKVIGYNCRFLQGSKTDRESVRRLKVAIEKGEEICEALMNYTRDGRPFVNLLLLAPLRDGQGKVRYYLGAQVDCSALVEVRGD
jgi:PAS domain S-box-containing protein